MVIPKDKNIPSIELCILLYSFQKRFWWMLSSLSQQIGDIPNLSIKVNIHKDDPYKHITKSLIKTFDGLLDIKLKEYDCEEFGFRSYTRNFDIIETTSDWLLFSDADIVFHPNFFMEFLVIMQQQFDKCKNTMTSVPRYTMGPEHGNSLVDSEVYTTLPIDKAFEKGFTTYPVEWSGGTSVPCGAWYFQFMYTEFIRNMPYIENIRRERSLFSKKGNKFWGDKIFRNKLPRSIFRVKRISPIVHISHYKKRHPKWIDECK